MHHQDLDRIRGVKSLDPMFERKLTRTERLTRWADLLDAQAARPLRALEDVEYVSPAVRRDLRKDESPLAVAFADPLLRTDGLPSDRLGDAMAYFGLTERQAHWLLCDCHYGGRMTASEVAARVRDEARPLYDVLRPQLLASLSGAGVLAAALATVAFL
ncbi:hypothetical protein [Magnetospirillum sp. UT-4]|uniref:hypothetical protein n=1 Tax=Magnetospirillum sp. UT-4 TaxID=2681467 RepID=UPI001385BA3C|nr:hypothetical protein [Magnetospirillum sp. UT-4]CAA7623774.1 conserved hypothetical protein [Magnetospirillum sp. UT-4]